MNLDIRSFRVLNDEAISHDHLVLKKLSEQNFKRLYYE